MPGRRWSDGQHQAIEAKETWPIQIRKRRLLPASPIRISSALSRGLAGMTRHRPTRRSGIREQLTRLEVTVVSHHRTRSRLDLVDQVYTRTRRQMGAVAARNRWPSTRPIGRRWWNHQRGEIRLLSAFLPEQGNPPQPVERQPENVSGG